VRTNRNSTGQSGAVANATTCILLDGLSEVIF